MGVHGCIKTGSGLALTVFTQQRGQTHGERNGVFLEPKEVHDFWSLLIFLFLILLLSFFSLALSEA